VIVTSGIHEKQFTVDQTQPLPSGQRFVAEVEAIEL